MNYRVDLNLTTYLVLCYDTRDNGVFSPGAVIAIDEPSRVDSWLGNTSASSIPLLELPNSVLVVDQALSSVKLPEVPHNVRVTNMQGFHYARVKLDSVSVKLIDVNCIGKLCDCLGMFSQGTIANCCSCFSVTSRLGRTVALVTMRVMSYPANSDAHPSLLFPVNNFTSRRFTSFFCQNECIPSDISALSLDRRANKLFARSVRAVVEKVNDEAGWHITGWARRGHVRDINSSSANSNQGQVGGASASNQIVASNLVFHPISIIPNKKENGEDVDVNELRFSFASSA